jgi:hypothetical protein
MLEQNMIEKVEKPDFKPLYDEYTKYSSSLGIESDITSQQFESILSGTADPILFNHFRTLNTNLSDLDKIKNNHTLSYSPPGINLPGGGSGMGLLDGVIGTVVGMGVDAATDAAGRGIRGIVSKVENAVESFKTRTSVINTPGGGGSGTIYNRSEGFGSNGSESPYVMNTEPMKVEFLTGIKSTLYPPVINVPTWGLDELGNSDDIQYTADLACVQLRVPASNGFCAEYWKEVYVPNLQLRAQASVGFNIQANVNFSLVNVNAYFNLLLEALSKFFFLVNTYSVLQGPGQRDISRNRLRQMFNVEDVQYLSILKQRLDALPIPPAMIAECAQMYAVYKTNNNSDCSNTIGFTPFPLIATNTNFAQFDTMNIDLGGLINRLGELNTASGLKQTVDMMARVFPSWVATTVHATQTFPEYSEKFIARFINSPGVQTEYVNNPGPTHFMPFVGSTSAEVKFAITQEFEPSEIGDIQASCSICDASNNLEWSGTMNPYMSVYTLNESIRETNRYTFALTPTNGLQWIPSNTSTDVTTGYSGTSLRQPYVNYLAGQTTYYQEPFGTYCLLGNSIQAMSQTTIEWLSKMFDLDSSLAKSPSKRNFRSSKSKPSRKGKGKKRLKSEVDSEEA